MKQIRWILTGAGALFLLIGAWLWWVNPQSVDMSGYAPANSLLYLESNQPLAIADAVTGTEAWRSFEGMLGPGSSLGSSWTNAFIRRSGIGPIESVILARSQVAVIVTELGTAEEGETLNVKPEWALIVQTHTSEQRIRQPIEEALTKLADRTYDKPTFRKVVIDGVEYHEWSSRDSRQIVAAFLGSLVFVSNSQQVVQGCIAVARGAPSLKNDVELHRARTVVGAESALTFGYVPRQSSSRLLAVGLPLVMGRAPGDSDFQRFITVGAAKIFGSLAWSSRPSGNGIEDRYSIVLQAPMVDRLRPHFEQRLNYSSEALVPSQFYSLTYYRFSNPTETWGALKTSVSAQVDALSAIIFTTLLRSALNSYGVDDPELFLQSVQGDIVTARLDSSGERSLLIATVKDQASLRKYFAEKNASGMRAEQINGAELLASPNNETTVAFLNNWVIVGTPTEVRSYIADANRVTLANLRRTEFVDSSSPANIVTLSDDSDRVRSFVEAVVAAKGTQSTRTAQFDQLPKLPLSVTETRISSDGFERITRSPLGQFSTLLPLVMPAQTRSPQPSIPR